MKSSPAFTLIELVFIIVVLGILAAVAYPRIAPLREDAEIAKGKGDVATIRAGIVNERQTRLIKGDAKWILNGTAITNGKKPMDYDANNVGLFGGVLTTPMSDNNASGSWHVQTRGSGTYYYRVGSSINTFKYHDGDDANASKKGQFLCTSGTECSQLTN